MKEYKIETKPTFWEVNLDQGAYSDWTTESLFFRGNDENEVWDMLCRYIEDIFDIEDWNRKKALVWGEKKYFVKKEKSNEDEVNWDTCYGDAWSVAINRLKVIEFLK